MASASAAIRRGRHSTSERVSSLKVEMSKSYGEERRVGEAMGDSSSLRSIWHGGRKPLLSERRKFDEPKFIGGGVCDGDILGCGDGDGGG